MADSKAAEVRRWKNDEILEALLEGIYRGQHLSHIPHLSDNYISGLDLSKTKPVLILSLSNGQHFEISAKRLAP